MTLFIDLRATPSGGVCAAEATVWEDGVRLISTEEFIARIQGFNVVLATHGFNVSRGAGIQALACWSALLQLSPAEVFVGVLWPGDSKFLPVLDYPIEGDEAVKSGRLLANFLNRNAKGAASLSLVSHSLGARRVLEKLDKLDRAVRRLVLMAAAIEDNCFQSEYQSAVAKAEKIYTLASRKDWVLQFAFPIGNPVGEIVMRGHPYFKSALGRAGPAEPIPLEQCGGSWQIPDGWKYGHGDYLPDNAIAEQIAPPIQPPGPTLAIPVNP